MTECLEATQEVPRKYNQLPTLIQFSNMKWTLTKFLNRIESI